MILCEGPDMVSAILPVPERMCMLDVLQNSQYSLPGWPGWICRVRCNLCTDIVKAMSPPCSDHHFAPLPDAQHYTWQAWLQPFAPAAQRSPRVCQAYLAAEDKADAL